MPAPPRRCARLRAASLAALAALLAPSAARAGDFPFAPAGVARYEFGTSYEATWSYGAAAFAPAGSGVRAAGLRLRETNGPMISFLLQVLSALGGAAGTTSSAKDDYRGGRIERAEAERRIAEGDARAQQMLTHMYEGSLFDTDLTLYSDKFGGSVGGFDLRTWIGKHGFQAGPSWAVFEWGLKGARLWGPTLARPEVQELFDHAHLGGMLQLRLDVTRFAELDVRWEPNLLRLMGAANHQSPLVLGAWVSPVEQLLVGAEAVWTEPGASPSGYQLAVGVRL